MGKNGKKSEKESKKKKNKNTDVESKVSTPKFFSAERFNDLHRERKDVTERLGKELLLSAMNGAAQAEFVGMSANTKTLVTRLRDINKEIDESLTASPEQIIAIYYKAINHKDFSKVYNPDTASDKLETFDQMSTALARIGFHDTLLEDDGYNGVPDVWNGILSSIESAQLWRYLQQCILLDESRLNAAGASATAVAAQQ